MSLPKLKLISFSHIFDIIIVCRFFQKTGTRNDMVIIQVKFGINLPSSFFELFLKFKNFKNSTRLTYSKFRDTNHVIPG